MQHAAYCIDSASNRAKRKSVWRCNTDMAKWRNNHCNFPFLINNQNCQATTFVVPVFPLLELEMHIALYFGAALPPLKMSDRRC